MIDAPILFSAPMVRAIQREIAAPGSGKTQTRRVLGPGTTWFDGRGWAKRHKAQSWDWAGAWVDAGPSPAGNPGPYLKLPWLGGPDPKGFEGTVHRIYPRHQPGMRLWVRERWNTWGIFDDMAPSRLTGKEGIAYAADMADPPSEACGRLRQGMFMPRWASRLTPLVTEVRVQRLHDITDADAIAEGLEVAPNCAIDLATGRPVPGYFVELPDGRRVGGTVESPRRTFALLWRALHPDEISLLDEDGRKIGMAPNPARWDANPWVIATTFIPFPCNVDQLPEARHAAA